MPLYGWEAPDDGQKDWPKHVELLLTIIKLELSASVGFIHKEDAQMFLQPQFVLYTELGCDSLIHTNGATQARLICIVVFSLYAGKN
jgi:hypothetical protein